ASRDYALQLVGGEGQNVADLGGARGEHHETIETEGNSGRRWQSLAEGSDQLVVDRRDRLTARGAHALILDEALALLDRIDQLVERVRELDASDVGLEAQRRFRVVVTASRERGERNRPVLDEHRVIERGDRRL